MRLNYLEPPYIVIKIFKARPRTYWKN